MNVCFWCRRAKDENDTEGKPECFDYDACKRCEEKMNQGITIIQINPVSTKHPPIKDDLYPTGKWVVIKEERVLKDFKDWNSITDVLETKHMYMNIPSWKSYGLPE